MVSSTSPTRTERWRKRPTEEVPAPEAMSTSPAERAAMTMKATVQSCHRRRSTASSEGVENWRSPTTLASRASCCGSAAMLRVSARGTPALTSFPLSRESDISVSLALGLLWTDQQGAVDLVGAGVDVEVDHVLA